MPAQTIQIDDIRFREAVAEDADRLDRALAALSEHLGDGYLATPDLLRRTGLGGGIVFTAIIAEADNRIVGLALASPVLSTMRGGAGAYVSDLWVDDGIRGSGLGARLLAETARICGARWGAMFLKLSVYGDNLDARAFYERLGFEPAERESSMTLASEALAALRNSGGSNR
ncbi:MAG: N-acetyltransferase [Pseudomonadota bacterium]